MCQEPNCILLGTGKSLLLRAIINALRRKYSKKPEAVAVTASTGMAASNVGGTQPYSYWMFTQANSVLLVGTTIHAWGAITPGLHDIDKLISYIKTCRPAHQRWKNTKVLVIDEVSMVDCRHMYKICAQMCKAMSNSEQPFGGINIICAGDFAQLPPAMASYTLYSNKIDTSVHTTGEYARQEAVIGKAIWHQITTVVILRQNMRQKTQTKKDANFRTALENMRYKMCTDKAHRSVNMERTYRTRYCADVAAAQCWIQ